MFVTVRLKIACSAALVNRKDLGLQSVLVDVIHSAQNHDKKTSRLAK